MESIFTPMLVVAVVATACFIMTFLVRKVVETGWPALKPMKITADDAAKGTALEASRTSGNVAIYSSKMAQWWNEVILYAMSPIWGGLFGFAMRNVTFFPEEVRGAPFAVMFGVCVGFMCGFFFKLLKKLFLDKAGITDASALPSSSVPPPPGS